MGIETDKVNDNFSVLSLISYTHVHHRLPSIMKSMLIG